MTETKFFVGELVLFFTDGGALINPPTHEEVTDEVLNRGTWGSIVRVDPHAVTIDTGEETRVITKPDYEKIWFSYDKKRDAKRPIRTALTERLLTAKAEDIINIRPIAEA